MTKEEELKYEYEQECIEKAKKEELEDMSSWELVELITDDIDVQEILKDNIPHNRLIEIILEKELY